MFDNPGIIEQDSFTCGVTAPAGVDISLEVLFNGSSIGTVNSQGPGVAESFQYNATWLINDEGTYTIVINNENGGESCDPMTISVRSKSFQRSGFAPIPRCSSYNVFWLISSLKRLPNVERETGQRVVGIVNPVGSSDITVCVLGTTVGEHSDVC